MNDEKTKTEKTIKQVQTGPERRKEAARLAAAFEREAEKSLAKGLSLATVQSVMTDANADFQLIKTGV